MSCAMFMKSASPVFFTLMYMVFPLLQYPAVYIQTSGRRLVIKWNLKLMKKEYLKNIEYFNADSIKKEYLKNREYFNAYLK